jgi:hypothetical protein
MAHSEGEGGARVNWGLGEGGWRAKYIGNKEIKAGHCLRREQRWIAEAWGGGGGGGGTLLTELQGTLYSTAQMLIRPLLFLKLKRSREIALWKRKSWKSNEHKERKN